MNTNILNKPFKRTHLEKHYAKAEQEMEQDPESKAEMELWEQTTGDGLDDNDKENY